MKLSDADFIRELKSGPVGRDLAATREADRLKRAKVLAKQRADEETRFVAEFPKFEAAEKKTLDFFHEAAQHFENAKRQADLAYFARVGAQTEVAKALGAINGELMLAANPLYREFCAKLSAIAIDARKITLFSETRRDDPKKPLNNNVYTSRAARHSIMFLPVRIMNALSEVVLAGLDSDDNLSAIYDAGIAALPHEEALRLEDNIPSQYSPRFEAAVEAFSAAIDAALEHALKGAKIR
jgi:hypothetical protein